MQSITEKRIVGVVFTLLMMVLPLWAIYFYQYDESLWGRFSVLGCVLILGAMFMNGIRMWRTAAGAQRQD